MKINLTIRWIFICIVWAGTIPLTYWNTYEIGLIMKEIEKEEIFRMDDTFWEYNSRNISQVLTKRDSLMLPVDSIKLGLLSVENSLTSLSSKFNFHDVHIESIPTQTNDTVIPVNVYFEGPFAGILPWLNTLENELSYLPVRHVKITADSASKQAQFQFSLYFRYKLSDFMGQVQ